MKVLLTGAFKYTKEHFDEFIENGHEIVYIEREDDKDIYSKIDVNEIEAIICNWFFVYHPIEAFKNLKKVQLLSAGFDRVPVKYIEENSIELMNARGVYSIPMAEHAISGVLQLYRKSRYFYENQKEHKWTKNRSLLELYSKKVCIIGCGSVGIECAKRFSAFTDEVIGLDIDTSEKPFFKKICLIDDIDSFIPDMDIIVLTLPLNQKTIRLIDDKRLKKCKQGVIIVNIARGPIIDQEALINQLECGQIGGAVLDVFEKEPLEAEIKLWDFENVIITPHNSFVSERNDLRMWNVIKESFGLE